MNQKHCLIVAAAVCSLFAFNPAARAQGTAFTYQGRLNSGTNAATGSYDLRFALFDAVTAGAQQGSLLTNSATAVSNGLFTVTLDFGNQFPGAPRWLEIAVRTNGVTTFTNLAPRQPLTPAPYAVYAGSANATNLVGTVQSANLSGVALLNANQTFTGGNTFNGSVGIGTAPAGSVPLSVQGSSSIGDGVIEAFQNGGATSGYGVAGYSLLPGGRGVVGEADTELPNVTGPGASDIGVTGASFGTNGTGVFGLAGASTGVNYGVVGQSFSAQGYAGYFLGQSYFGGSVGIGTTSPTKQLDLTGTASGVVAGNSIDSSIFMRLNNTASDGNTSAPDFAGIGFGHNSTRQAIVGGTFGNDFLDFYTGGSLTAPKMRIDINGTVGIMTNDVLELGYGVAGKESNAGKIGYEKFTADSLDIVGAGTNSASRKIKFWAEGGATFSGNVTATSFAGIFAGSGSGLTNVALLTGGNALTGQQTVMSGNVGISTTTPKHKLDVNGNIFLGTAFNGQIFTELGDTLYLGASRKYLSSTLGAPINGSTDWINLMCHPLSRGIMFGTAGPSDADPHSAPNPLMIIQSNGNVGIGTTNATSLLTVNGFGSPAISLIGNGNSAGGQLDFGLAGFATAYSTSANASDAVIRQSGKGKLFLQTGSGAAAITIATNNNVGIGTSTPTNTLQVNGTIAASALRAPGAGVNTGTYAFIQRAVATNTTGNQTFIFNPVCDGDPNAILIVTHNWSADTNSTSQYNTKPVGVYYTGANWAIFNEDTSAIALGRAFNVMVIKP